MLLTALRESGLELGVISNFDYRIYSILEALGLTRHFDSIMISSEAGYAKPAPEIFRMALQRHSLVPSQALHVGDSEALDVVGAHAAGIAAVLVDPDAVPLAETPSPMPLGKRKPIRTDGQCVRVRSLSEVAAGARSADFFLTRVALLTLLSREFGKEIAAGGPAAFECRACSARAGLDAFNRGAVVIETDDDPVLAALEGQNVYAGFSKRCADFIERLVLELRPVRG